MSHTVLVVDDDPEIRDVLREALEENGYSVLTARDGKEVRLLLARDWVDLVILDAVLPGESGSSIADWIAREKKLPMILLSGDWSAYQSLKSYPYVRLSKPIRMSSLLQVIDQEIRATTGQAPEPSLMVGEKRPPT
jgi:DNA-binding response OmpR family regulator